MDPILITPNELDFGSVALVDKPISVDFTIENISSSFLEIFFEEASVKYLYFTHINEVVQYQRQSGFDIFYNFNRIQKLGILPDEKKQISCVFIPSKFDKRFGDIIKIPADAYDIESVNTTDTSYDKTTDDFPAYKTSIGINIKVDVSPATFRLEPQHIFLRDCMIDKEITKEFTLKNYCNVPLLIAISKTPNLTVITPKISDFVELPPKSSVVMKLRYIPSGVGQFEHNIEFNCLISKETPQVLKVLTAVSTCQFPPDFPFIGSDNSELDFGHVYSGIEVEKSFNITNNSGSSYNIFIIGMTDLFLGSVHDTDTFSTTPETYPLIDIPNQDTNSLCFRTQYVPHFEKEISFLLNRHSSQSIMVKYVPSFNIKCDHTTFDERTFIILLKFTNVDNGLVYYRLLRCLSSVCHSSFSITPSLIDLGDSVTVKDVKEIIVTLENNTPMPTEIYATSSTISLIINPASIHIDANSKKQVSIKFYPRRVYVEFSGTVSFCNKFNPNNDAILNVTANVFVGKKESIHSDSYSITIDKTPIHYIDFSNCTTTYPSIRHMVIKNRLNKDITLTFDPSSPKEIRIFHEKIDNIEEFDEKNKVDTSLFLKNNFKLLTLRQLAKFFKRLHDFYMNPFVFTSKGKTSQIIEHFTSLKSMYHEVLEKGKDIKDVTGKEITIPQKGKIDLYASYTPLENVSDKSNIWIHRREKFRIYLKGSNAEPLLLPISVNVSSSKSFLNMENLNFGNVNFGSTRSHEIRIANTSTVPLLYKLQVESPITILRNVEGVILPLGRLTVPFSVSPTGTMNSRIHFINVLNESEKKVINIKANVTKAVDFLVDPSILSFNKVMAGSSSKSMKLSVSNISSDSHSYTISHNQRKGPSVNLLFSVLSHTKELTESNELQIEKLNRKLKIYQRKGRTSKASQIKLKLDELKETSVGSTEADIKKMSAKYMNRFSYYSGPHQSHIIEVQIIPNAIVKEDNSSVIGSIEVRCNDYDSVKSIAYSAIIMQETRKIFDNAGSQVIEVTPKQITIDEICVHDSFEKNIKIQNKTDRDHEFWITHDFGFDGVITTTYSQGIVKANAACTIPFTYFAIQPCDVSKKITITTKNSSDYVTLHIKSKYREVLSFHDINNQTIDFGSIPLVYLRSIEEKRHFKFQNISNSTIYVFIKNPNPKDILIYEIDPEEPVHKWISIPQMRTITLTITLKPDISRDNYRFYKAIVIEETIDVIAFETEDDAMKYFSNPTIYPDCVFLKKIHIKAIIGRVGFSVSESHLLFGSCQEKNKTFTRKIIVKNRSSHIPLNMVVTSSDLMVNTKSFRIAGKVDGSESSKELELSFTTYTIGLNQANLTLSCDSYSKQVTCICFVEPGILNTNLEKNEFGVDTYNIPGLYIDDNDLRKVIISFEIENLSNRSVKFKIKDSIYDGLFLNKRAKESFSFEFPLGKIKYANGRELKSSFFIVDSSEHQVLKVVEVVGEVGVSTSSVSPDVLNFELFGNVNDWKYKQLFITVENTSNVPLILNSTDVPNYITFPSEIRLDKYTSGNFEVVPNIENLKTNEGILECSFRLVNPNNRKNSFTIPVKFDLAMKALRFEHLESEYIAINRITKIEKDNSHVLIGNTWFGVTNRMLEECSYTISVTEFISDISINLFLRSSETQVSNIDLQSNESVELRVRIAMDASIDIKNNNEVIIIGEVVFKKDDEEVDKIEIALYTENNDAEKVVPPSTDISQDEN